MLKFLSKKEKEKAKKSFVIAFCDEPDLKTKFGQYYEIFETYEDAKQRIFSKVNGWGKAIQIKKGDIVKVDSGWLIIEQVN